MPEKKKNIISKLIAAIADICSLTFLMWTRGVAIVLLGIAVISLAYFDILVAYYRGVEWKSLVDNALFVLEMALIVFLANNAIRYKEKEGKNK